VDKKPTLATITLEIDPAVLKRVVEAGKVTEFLDAMPALVAGNIKAQIVEHLVSGSAGKAIFTFDDDFGTGPHPWPWLDVGIPAMIRGMRRQ
jgi:hypothetical protein